jgi:hypothetical protein
MKRLILVLAAVASFSFVAAPANAQMGSGGAPVHADEGYRPYPPHYGSYVGPFGGDALYGAYGPGPGYIEHDEWRPRRYRYWHRPHYRHDGYYPY